MEEKNKAWKTVSSKYLFRRPWLTVRCEDMLLPNGNHIPEYYILLADTGKEFITSSFDSRTVLADKNELTIFGNGNGIYPVGILKDIILGDMIPIGK